MNSKHIILFLSTLALLISKPGLSQNEFEFKTAQKLSSAINSEYEESSPIFDPNTQTLYFTRTFHPENEGGASAGQDIWFSKKTTTSWSLPSNDLPNLNNYLNNSVIGVSKTGNDLFLLGSYAKKITLQQGFSSSAFSNNDWSQPTELDISSLKFTSDFYGGWLNDEGNILILSMESRGGEGQEDLYISIKTDGKWSRPEWMGSIINSPGYEISPMLVNDNKVLLFASSGHNGLGDCDIFYAVKQDSTFTNWSEPVNLGAPVNSTRFDGFPFLVKDQLYFASNRADTFSDIYLSINTLFFEEADTMRLAFQMFGTQLNDVELTIKDRAGQTIGNYFSGSNGIVNIGGLSQNTDYLLYPSHADVDLSLFSPYVLNEKDEIIEKLNSNPDGSITAKALSKVEIQSKEIMAQPSFVAGMQGVYELENVPVRNVLLALVDQNGNPVQYSKTDNQGKFVFADTDDSLKLSIKVLSQLEYLKENGTIFFTDAKGKKLFKASATETGTFAYQKLEAQQLAQLKMLQQVDRSKPAESKGVYKYKNLPKEGVVLHLYDENDQIIETVTTDENGEFIFKKLRPDQAFKIKPAEEEDGGLIDGSFLALYDNDGEEMDLFSRSIDGTGGFNYKPLSSDVVWGLTLNAYEDVSMSYIQPQNMVFSTGLFKFQNLPREGVKLKLLDENDNLIETVTTDANGQFVFSMLRNDKKYRIEVESMNDEQVDQSQIYFVGKEGDVTTAKSMGDKSFAFDELNPDYFFSISEVNEGKTELTLTESFKDVRGKFKYQNLPKEGVKLFLIDENGNVIETVFTDANGNFKFNKLAREKNYVIRLSEEDGSMMDQSAFVMTNEENEELEQEMDANGEFSFKTLPKEASKLTAKDLIDGPGLNEIPFEIENKTAEDNKVIEIVLKPEPLAEESFQRDDLKLHQVNFAFNSIRISERDRYYINQNVMPLAKKTDEPILIVGYSCDLGEQTEQGSISILRAQQIKTYLIGMGIDESRIEITGLGTTLTQENSTYESRAANRKAEVYLLGR